MTSNIFKHLINFSSKISLQNVNNLKNIRSISTTNCIFKYDVMPDRIHQIEVFDHYFKREKKKDKETFVNLVDLWKRRQFRTGHVEFVYCALKRMYDYGVNEDLEVYKKIIDIMPKGSMVPESVFQADMLYFPKHQMAITDLLVQMEENDVTPDRDLQELLISVFGRRSQPIKKYWRMMYWLPKFKNLSPWPLPEKVPKDPIELSKMALERICSVDLESEIQVFKTNELEDDTENTWIVNGLSPIQRTLFEHHPLNQPIYLEGGFRIYLRKSAITYFVLRADIPPNRRRKTKRDVDVVKNLKIPFFDHPDTDDLIPKFSVHEQKEGIIYAVAATGTSSKDSLTSWLRLLEKHVNPRIGKIPIIFRMASPLGNSMPIDGIEAGEAIKQIAKE